MVAPALGKGRRGCWGRTTLYSMYYLCCQCGLTRPAGQVWCTHLEMLADGVSAHICYNILILLYIYPDTNLCFPPRYPLLDEQNGNLGSSLGVWAGSQAWSGLNPSMIGQRPRFVPSRALRSRWRAWRDTSSSSVYRAKASIRYHSVALFLGSILFSLVPPPAKRLRPRRGAGR